MATDTKNEVVVANKSATKPAQDVSEPRPVSLFSPLEEVEHLFDRLMPRAWMPAPMAWKWPMWGGLDQALESTRIPQLDVIDQDKEILIRAEMPGVEKKDIDVSLTNNTLNIKGSCSHESTTQKSNYVRCERSAGNFSRSLAIPEGVDTSKITAHLKDGILEIVLPKEEAMQRRSVEVK